MIEQFNFDIRLIFAILNGKVSAAINRKLYRNFRQNGLEISPEQWTVLIFLWEKDGVTQQELCNATFKDKPSMTRLDRQHGTAASCSTYFRQKRSPHQSDPPDKRRKRTGREGTHHCGTDTEGSSAWHHSRRTEHRAGGLKKGILQYQRLNRKTIV